MKKNGRENDLHDGDEEEVGEDLGEEELGAGGGRHALRVEDLMADFARPGLVERGDRGEQGGDAEDAAGDSREKAPRGSKASEKSTTTRSAKKSMELMASLERHSMRRSRVRGGEEVGSGHESRKQGIGIREQAHWIHLVRSVMVVGASDSAALR